HDATVPHGPYPPPQVARRAGHAVAAAMSPVAALKAGVMQRQWTDERRADELFPRALRDRLHDRREQLVVVVHVDESRTGRRLEGLGEYGGDGVAPIGHPGACAVAGDPRRMRQQLSDRDAALVLGRVGEKADETIVERQLVRL